MPKQRAERRYFMKKGDIYEGTVEKIEFPNKGILHIDGERVVVKNAIPGQKIQCVITKRRKGNTIMPSCIISQCRFIIIPFGPIYRFHTHQVWEPA